MMMPMIVTFREFFEMFLILVPLAAYLHKINQTKLTKYIFTGGIAGLLSTLLTGVFLYNTTSKLEGYAENLFMGSTMLFLSGLILYSMVIIKKQSKGIEDYEDGNNTFSAYSLFLLAFLTIFRESLEILIFCVPFLHTDFLPTLSGVLIGFTISLTTMFIVFKTAAKLNVNLIFTILNLMLIFIGASLFGEAIATLLPDINDSIELAGTLMYAIPVGFIFIKTELKKYLKKSNK